LKLHLLVAGVAASIGIMMILAGTLLFVAGYLQPQQLRAALSSTTTKAIFESSKSGLPSSASAPFGAIDHSLLPVSTIDNDLDNDGNFDGVAAPLAVSVLFVALPIIVLGLLSFWDNWLLLALCEVARLSSVSFPIPKHPG
jgi:hypothetical protein